jgi:hypothetical protein
MRHAALLLGTVELYLTVIREGSGVAHVAHVFGALGAIGYLRGVQWWTVRSSVRQAWLPAATLRRAREAKSRDIPWEL